MRTAFAACMAFLTLMVVVAVRFGCRESSRETPIADAAVADAPLADAPVVPDAAPPPKKPVPKPTAKPKPKPTAKPKPPPTPTPTPTPPPEVEVVTPVAPTPGRPQCTHPPNPAGCPAKEPNVNRPCDAEGVHCIYGTSCCPFEYVCKGGAFEAWFTSCP